MKKRKPGAKRKDPNSYPKGWTAHSVQDLINHYENHPKTAPSPRTRRPTAAP